jgi:hypothetical protein
MDSEDCKHYCKGMLYVTIIGKKLVKREIESGNLHTYCRSTDNFTSPDNVSHPWANDSCTVYLLYDRFDRNSRNSQF